MYIYTYRRRERACKVSKAGGDQIERVSSGAVENHRPWLRLVSPAKPMNINQQTAH